MARLDHRGTWALVTGASSGIGEEFARKLAERGANLVLAARSGERLERLAGDLTRVNGVEVRPIAVDLAEPRGPALLLDAISATGVFVELVVNNAGFGSAGPFVSLDASREAAMVSLNCGALVSLTRGLLDAMVRAGRGGVINVASTAAFQPVPYMATYGASKAFVVSFTLALASELHRTGVRAMALCPGPVRTGFQESAGFSGSANPLAELTAAQTVERGLAAYERKKTLCVTGFVNGVQVGAAKLLPRSVVNFGTVQAMRRLGRTKKTGPAGASD
jgi:short-subunit dehydrogenase